MQQTKSPQSPSTAFLGDDPNKHNHFYTDYTDLEGMESIEMAEESRTLKNWSEGRKFPNLSRQAWPEEAIGR